jgi:hypothetical protein
MPTASSITRDVKTLNVTSNTTITISKSEKKHAKDQHLGLLSRIRAENSLLAVYYTDASRGPDKHNKTTNSAAICRIGPQNNILQAQHWNLGYMLEIADAELIGIYRALRAILAVAQQSLISTAYIFSDSQAAIFKLAGYSYCAIQARSVMHKLGLQHIQLYIQWCPSHCGIIGNETADYLAKKGLLSPPATRGFISISYIRRIAKEGILANWEATWAIEEEKETRGLKSAGLGIHYRRIAQDMLTYSLKPKLPSLARPHLAAYIQLKTGIGYLKPFLRRIGKLADDRCKRCNVQQTVRHLLLDCKEYDTERKKLRWALDGLPLTLKVLFNTSKGKEAIAEFLTSTKIATAQWVREQ